MLVWKALHFIQNKNIWLNKKVDKEYMFEINPQENQSSHDIYMQQAQLYQ